MFKKITFITAPLLFIACSGGDVADVSSVTDVATAATEKMDTMKDKAMDVVAMAPKTKAVLVYADWCGSCKVLDPKIEKVKSMGAIPGVEFVVLDYTAKDADAFYADAKAAGVEDAIRTHLNGTIKTGQLLLVDLDDQTVRGTVKKDMDTGAILGKIKDVVAAS